MKILIIEDEYNLADAIGTKLEKENFSVDILNKTLIKKKNIFNYLNAFAKNYFAYFDL